MGRGASGQSEVQPKDRSPSPALYMGPYFSTQHPSSPLSQPGRAHPTALFALASSGTESRSLGTKAKSKMIRKATLYASPA